MTTRIAFDGELTCALEVGDITRSMAWYREVLCFERLYHVDEMAWCELASPVQNVTVGLSQVEAPQVRGGATLTFGVEDVDAARAHLESRDVRFDGETQTVPGMVKLATFYDPDGHTFMLAQDLSG
jgi:predicted enzyme related to lactoylglutathione lyase